MSNKRDEDNSKYLENIFESIKSGEVKPKSLGRHWLELNSSNEYESFVSICSLILDSSGIPTSQPDYRPSLKSKKSFLRYLEKNSRNITTYPLQFFLKSEKIKNFQDFFKCIALYSEDQPDALEKALEWMIELSGFTVRSVRQSTVWAFSGLMVGYIELQKKLEKKVEILEAKTGSFSQERKLLVEKVKYIESLIANLYENVVCVRCKDVNYETRLVIVSIIEKLITNNSFDLRDILKEILGDSKSDVRQKVLMALDKVKDDGLQDYHEILFKMCFDVDDKCCALAIQLCKKLELSERKIKKLQSLIWAESKVIRKAAGDYLIHTAFGNLPQGLSDPVGGLDQSKYLSIEKGLLSLVDYFITNSPGYFASDIFIELLWPKTSAIRSCSVMCDLLSRGCKSGSSSLDEKSKIVILCFIESTFKYLSIDLKKKNSLIDYSFFMFSKLNELITYYKEEKNIIKYLVKIPALLDLNTLASNDLKENFNLLISTISDIFMRYKDLEILKNCSNALVRFAESNHPMKKEAKSEVVRLLNSMFEVDLIEALPQISAMIAFNDLSEHLELRHLKILKHNLDEIPETVNHFMFYWHLWKLLDTDKNKSSDSDYITIRDAALEFFLHVMEQHAYHQPGFAALGFLCETLFYISDRKNTKERFFFNIKENIWQAIEKFMIYMYLPTKEEDDLNDAEKVCILISRILYTCSDLTISHLCSSFIAFFGRSKLLRINTIVKQVLQSFKNQDQEAKGIFTDRKLIFKIYFDALNKVICHGNEENIADLKELAGKILHFVPLSKSEENGGRFKEFINEVISFSFIDHHNLHILNSILVLVDKSTMNTEDIQEIYEHIKYYSPAFTKDAEPIRSVLDYLKKFIPDTYEESDEEQKSAKKPKTRKKSITKVVSTRKRTRSSLNQESAAKKKKKN